jgi:hypothetical protein
MSLILLAAGWLSVIIGLIHSVLGELLIFRHLREDSFVPMIAIPPLHERNTRILWATWHATTFFGWAIGAILISLAYSTQGSTQAVVQIIAFSMFVASIMVLIATKARHPGCIGLLSVAILCWLS